MRFMSEIGSVASAIPAKRPFTVDPAIRARLRPAAAIAWTRELDGLTTEDPERPGVVWKYVRQDGKLWTERTENGTVERFLIEYAFGSGRHATTFVTMLDRDPRRPVCREHRLTLFAHASSPGVTPGLSLAGHAVGNSDRGRVNSTADTLNCFRCHTTVTSDRGDDVLDEATMIPNIGCESCHGPARSTSRRPGDAKTEALSACLLGPAIGQQTNSFSFAEAATVCQP